MPHDLPPHRPSSTWTARLDAAFPHVNHVTLAIIICGVGFLGCASTLIGSGSIASIIAFACVGLLGTGYLMRARRRTRPPAISDRVPRHFYF